MASSTPLFEEVASRDVLGFSFGGRSYAGEQGARECGMILFPQRTGSPLLQWLHGFYLMLPLMSSVGRGYLCVSHQYLALSYLSLPQVPRAGTAVL